MAGEQKARRIPVRQCLGCNEHLPKASLIRVVRSPEGEISLDTTGKKSGRGAYICKKSACFKKARKNGRIASTLGVAVSDEIFDAIEAELSAQE